MLTWRVSCSKKWGQGMLTSQKFIWA
jgi:hypothetical protein